jgi:hypothetical protein
MFFDVGAPFVCKDVADLRPLDGFDQAQLTASMTLPNSAMMLSPAESGRQKLTQTGLRTQSHGGARKIRKQKVRQIADV